ncbi:MAG: arabinose operon regulatory protein [Paenibacillaceae bacterium]|jgi:AraC family transcriptional regulator of arabinose operon|nr:arabinose operon regulatory protein [Paenibacillaceae bacterium]
MQSLSILNLEWGFELRFIRQFVRPWSHTFGPYNNPFHVFWLVLEGKRTIQIDHTPVLLEQGNLVCFPPGVPIQMLAANSDNGEFHYLSIGCYARLGPFDLRHLFRNNTPIVKKRDLTRLESLAEVWQSACKEQLRLRQWRMNGLPHKSAGLQQASLCMLRLEGQMRIVYAELLALFGGMRALSIDTLDPRIVEACRYVREHVHDKFSLSQWAASVHLSPSHFSHLFNKVLGISPIKYLLDYRLQRAKDLLVHTVYSIKEIAELVGYSDQSQFSRAFRKAESVGPLSYRNNWRRIEELL